MSAVEQQRVRDEAARIEAELRTRSGPGSRCKMAERNRIRARYGEEPGMFVVALAHELWQVHDRHWHAYCLLRYHPEAFPLLDEAQVLALGQAVEHKGEADDYARMLAGPAWRHGILSDDVIQRWAHSDDSLWRRVALLCTTTLNTRGEGGTGDVPRTLAVVEMMVEDHDPLVVQALSVALRALVYFEAPAVRAFVSANEERLAARVVRDVKKKLAADARRRAAR